MHEVEFMWAAFRSHDDGQAILNARAKNHFFSTNCAHITLHLAILETFSLVIVLIPKQGTPVHFCITLHTLTPSSECIMLAPYSFYRNNLVENVSSYVHFVQKTGTDAGFTFLLHFYERIPWRRLQVAEHLLNIPSARNCPYRSPTARGHLLFGPICDLPFV